MNIIEYVDMLMLGRDDVVEVRIPLYHSFDHKFWNREADLVFYDGEDVELKLKDGSVIKKHLGPEPPPDAMQGVVVERPSPVFPDHKPGTAYVNPKAIKKLELYTGTVRDDVELPSEDVSENEDQPS